MGFQQFHVRLTCHACQCLADEAEQCVHQVQHRKEMKLPAAGAGQCVHNIDARQTEAETVPVAKALLPRPCMCTKLHALWNFR